MNFKLEPSRFFLNQYDLLSSSAKRQITNKLYVLKVNPYRFKRIKGFPFSLFRIRFSDKRKELRLVYVVEKNKVFLLCILKRSSVYKKLREYLEKLGYL